MSDDYKENYPSIEEELDYYKRECDSLRSQLAEAQSNYQTLLDAVNIEIELRKAAEDQLEEAQEKLKVAEDALTESRECLNGMVYSGPLQKSWMGRSRKSIKGSTAALQAIRSAS